MRLHRLRVALVAAALAALGGRSVAGQSQPPAAAPQAQPPAAAQPAAEPAAEADQPTFRAGVNFVRVDAIVTDRQGNPVTDLTADDFEIIEDDARQSIETFRFIKIDTAAPVEVSRPLNSRADEEAAAQSEDARIFVFFLDEYNVRLGSSLAARKHLIEFVQTQLGPRDLVSVMYPLSPLDTVVLTRDHNQLVSAIERFQGRKFDYTPRNSLEDRYANQPTEVVERIRRQVSLSALTGLAVKLGALREGRKAIVLVSEGYLAMLPPQLRNPIATMPGLGNPNRNNPLAGENNLTEDRVRFSAELDVQSELQRVFEEANRSNTSIYSVDPRGLATGEFDIQDNVVGRVSQDSLRQTQSTLQVLAENTDGRAIINRNDLAAGMKQIVRDSSAYYLLGYNSTQSRSDGKFHPIKVRVKRPGVQVRARKGYWALTAVETARATAPPKPGPPPAITKSLAGISTLDRRLIRTWIGTAPGDQGKTRVTVVWEGVPPPPGSTQAAVGRVVLTAGVPGSDAIFQGLVGEEVAPGAAATARRGSVSFEVPPGKLALKMSIEDTPDNVLDTDDRTIDVPDFTEPKTRLTTPRVYVARNAREFQAIKADDQAPPTATREFRRTERLFMRLTGTAPGGAGQPLTYAARLLNKQGGKMADLPVTPGADGGPATMDFPLSSLPAGEFLIEVSAKDAEGQDTTELVAFRMVG